MKSTVAIHVGDCLEQLRTLPDESVQCCVTSPPYWGLRDYGADGQIGLEETPEAFVDSMVEVFREVRRVLRPDGVCFVNLGESFASAAPNLPDVMHGLLKRGVLFFGGTDPRRRAAQRVHVLLQGELSPKSVFVPLLTAKRVGIKHGDNDLCEIGGGLDAPVACWASGTSSLSVPHDAAQLAMNQCEYARIIITTTDLNADSPFSILPSLPVKYGKASFSVEVSGEPPPEGVTAGIPALDSFTLNSFPVGVPDVNGVDKPVSLLDGPDLHACALSHFSVRKASKKEISFTFHSGGDLCFAAVSHLNLLSGSIVPYGTVLAQAQSIVNEMKPKQEVGIPEMVKRAMMRDGWICRQTIIWHKPNPMPESVKDRCTKAHEYVFLLTKSGRYYWDAEAIAESAVSGTDLGLLRSRQAGGETSATVAWYAKSIKDRQDAGVDSRTANIDGTRNARSVWTITTKGFSGCHFATFPPELPMKCIAVGSKKGDTVLDPFFGAGTTGLVAMKMGRNCIGIELNPEYAEIARKRIAAEAGLFGKVEVVNTA